MRAAASLLSLALALGACADAQIVYERDGSVPPPPRDAGDGTDASRDASEEMDAGDPCVSGPPPTGLPEETCMPARPPSRTVCDIGGDAGVVEGGFLDPLFRETDGYDLDGYCTSLDRVPVSCVNPRGTPPDTTSFGTDNALGLVVVPGLAIVDASLEMRFREAVRRGSGTPMMRVENWNGETEDPEVSVTLAISAGALEETPDCEATPTLQPANSFFDASDLPIAVDRTAHVSGGVLVARIPDGQPFTFDLVMSTLRVRLRDGRFTARLDETGRWVDGMLSGRWATADAEEALDALGVCESDVLLRMGALSLLAESADTRADPAEDMAELECNAISVAVRFETSVPIPWGERREPVFPTPCP